MPLREFIVTKTKDLLVALGETALVAIFPNIIPVQQTPSMVNILTTVSPQFEVRGYIEINQVSSADGETNPYTKRPAKLLITSEHRGTFLDNDFPSLTETTIPFSGSSIKVGLDFVQIAYTLPLAEGKALYELPGA